MAPARRWWHRLTDLMSAKCFSHRASECGLILLQGGGSV